MPESTSKTPSRSEDEPEIEEVDESSAESFPASDAPSWAMGKRAEPRSRPADAVERPSRTRREKHPADPRR